MKKVLGLGNALVDVLISIDNDSYLDKFGLPKGSMTLVDYGKANHIQDKTKHLNKDDFSITSSYTKRGPKRAGRELVLTMLEREIYE